MEYSECLRWLGLVPALRSSTGHRRCSESVAAAARSIQSKHFLPFFLSFLIYKTGIVIQLPFGKHFEVYGQSTSVHYIGADVFQPSCPLEIFTLHSLGSRGGQVHGLLLLLIRAVCQAPFAPAQLKGSCTFCVAEGYGQQPLLQGHRGQSEISHRLATGQ